MLVQKERIGLLTSTNKKISEQNVKNENLLNEQNKELSTLKNNINEILHDHEKLLNKITD